MISYELVLHYNIRWYHISCSFILSLLLIWSPFHSIQFYSILFYSILFYFISNRFDSIWFYTLLFNSIYYVVQYSISYQWMICVCLSVRPSVCLSVCLSVWISLCFLFSPVSSIFLFSFFSHERLPHTHTDTDTDTQIHMNMNICSFLWLVHITSKDGKWWIVFEW